MINGAQAEKIEQGELHESSGLNTKDIVRIVANDSVSERLFDLDRLLSLMIHQIRNHCMSVKGYASLLSYQGDVDDDSKKWISKINMGLCSLEDFLSGFENYRLSRIPSVSAVNLAFTVKSAIQMFSGEEIRGVRFYVDIPDDVKIVGDANDIRKMVYHAIRNAVEAVSEGGFVRVSFKSGDGIQGWVLEVEDNGCGMSREQLRQALELLFTTKNGHIGCGLNLIVAAAQRIGAVVEIDSARGAGTVLRIKKAE